MTRMHWVPAESVSACVLPSPQPKTGTCSTAVPPDLCEGQPQVARQTGRVAWGPDFSPMGRHLASATPAFLSLMILAIGPFSSARGLLVPEENDPEPRPWGPQILQPSCPGCVGPRSPSLCA